MLAITGSTGHLGSLIIQHLVTLLPPSSILALTRSTTSPAALLLAKHPKLTIRQADFSDPTSLPPALEGVTRLLIISVDKMGDEAVALHRTAIDAAVSAGVKKIYYTSHTGSRSDSPFPPGRDHAATEKYLEDKGVDFTSFRNGFFFSSLGHMIGGARVTGKVELPEDGKVSWTSVADLAEGTAQFLAKEGTSGREAGKYVHLVNSESWDMGDIARILSRVTGREVERVVRSAEEYVSGLVKRGVPEGYARAFAGNFAASHRGDFARTDGTLEQLLGRKPESVEVYLEREFKL